MNMRPSVVGRIGALLRTLAALEPTGATTTRLSNTTELARPTAHRLLTALQGEGMVDRDGTTGLWHLGPECFLLGAAATSRHDLTPLARETVLRIASNTGESAFFSLRRGDETVCVLREDGSFPIRSHVLHEGIRFPLGVASAGMAILAFLPSRERDEHLAHDLTTRFGPAHSHDALRARVTETRRLGYAVNPGLIVAGSWGLGAAIFDQLGAPRWALSITGIEARIAPPRQHELGQLLLHEADVLARRVKDARTSG